MKRCKLDNYYPGAVCKFAVKSYYNLDKHRLQMELRERLGEPTIQASKVRSYQGGLIDRNQTVYIYAITFSLVDSDLGINAIVDCLNTIEEDVEKALKVKQLAEMVE